jgi:hypothetical protein
LVVGRYSRKNKEGGRKRGILKFIDILIVKIKNNRPLATIIRTGSVARPIN